VYLLTEVALTYLAHQLRKVCPMDKFDILMKDESGDYFWIGSGSDFWSVNLRAARISVKIPGEYLIVDTLTGAKHPLQGPAPEVQTPAPDVTADAAVSSEP
jgi:hypothetical protein